MICSPVTRICHIFYITNIILHKLVDCRSLLCIILRRFIIWEVGVGMRESSLPMEQESLVTVRTVLGV